MDWLTFLHAGEFHLDQPLLGPPDPPEPLQQLLLQAPYEAATQVVDLAIENQVDFVVLSGGVVNWQWSGPRGPKFLVEQFEQLAASGIEVYWAAGPEELPQQWPQSLPLPQNVHVFSAQKVEKILHCRRGKPVATLLGLSRPEERKVRVEEFLVPDCVEPIIAVIHARAEGGALQRSGIHYWALGGSGEPRTLYCQDRAARFCGSPQARTPHQSGGTCTLVHMTPAGDIALEELPCAAAVYHQGILRTQSLNSPEQLREAFLQAAQECPRGKQPVLASWQVEAAGAELLALWDPQQHRRLLEQLWEWAQELAPPVWTLELVPGAAPGTEHPLWEQVEGALARQPLQSQWLPRLEQLGPEEDLLLVRELLQGFSPWHEELLPACRTLAQAVLAHASNKEPKP